jgi:hypothetical protein
MQSDMTEQMFGFNLHKMIHGGQHAAVREISSVPKQVQNDNGGTENTESENAEPVEQFGKAVLGGIDISMEVYVNGTRTQYMGRPIKVPLDEDVNITIRKPGYLPFSTTLKLSRNENSKVVNIPQLEKAKIGLLTTSQNYTAGSKLVYEVQGESIEKDLPFKDVEIPEGVYQAKVVNPILGTEKNVEFTIEESKKHFLE